MSFGHQNALVKDDAINTVDSVINTLGVTASQLQNLPEAFKDDTAEDYKALIIQWQKSIVDLVNNSKLALEAGYTQLLKEVKADIK